MGEPFVISQSDGPPPMKRGGKFGGYTDRYGQVVDTLIEADERWIEIDPAPMETSVFIHGVLLAYARRFVEVKQRAGVVHIRLKSKTKRWDDE